MESRFAILKYRLFLKGDYVRTYLGVGIIAENQSQAEDVIDLIYTNVKVQHKTGCSENTSNTIKEMELSSVIRINKKEYDK